VRATAELQGADAMENKLMLLIGAPARFSDENVSRLAELSRVRGVTSGAARAL